MWSEPNCQENACRPSRRLPRNRARSLSEIQCGVCEQNERIVAELGKEIATPDEARKILKLTNLEGIDTFTGLHHRLDTDLRFRYQCGLPLDREAPSISTLSRVFAELTKKGLAKQLFEDLVTRCQQEDILDGSNVAIDKRRSPCLREKATQTQKRANGQLQTGAQNLIPSVKLE